MIHGTRHLGGFLACLWVILIACPAGATPEELLGTEAAQAVAQHEVVPSVQRWEVVEDAPPRFEILLNIPATQLTLFDRGVPVRHHKVAVGTPRWPTPTGKFTIYEIQWNPWWLPPESEWAEKAEKTPPGPGNPLYPVKLMMQKALRIHGAKASWTVGRASSHGCMRMRRGEVRDLAEFLESQLVPEHGPAIFENYRRKTWQPFSTKLPEEKHIWVYMVYQPLERWSNQLVLHPNYYGRRIAYENEIMDLLMEAGVYTAPIDMGKFHAIRKKGRGTRVIPFQDLLADGSLPEEQSEHFASMCLLDQPNQLKQAREKYNTKLISTMVPLFQSAMDLHP
ncbi:MAG: L,D-transpeptidase [bacterium]|nr:L,D-transpeptidase [bacterium]